MRSVTDAVLSVGTAGTRRAAHWLSFSLPIWQAKTRQHATPFVLHFFPLDIIMSGL